MAVPVESDLDFGGTSKITGLPAPTSASDAVTKSYADGLGGGVAFVSFTIPGAASVGVGSARWYTTISRAVSNVTISGGVAPTGASLIADVNKNGTTVFTTQGNRPTLTAASYYDGSSTPDVTTMSPGDYLTVDIDQVGSTVPGSDIVVTVYF